MLPALALHARFEDQPLPAKQAGASSDASRDSSLKPTITIDKTYELTVNMRGIIVAVM